MLEQFHNMHGEPPFLSPVYQPERVWVNNVNLFELSSGHSGSCTIRVARRAGTLILPEKQDRTRITAEGSVRSCLFGDDETDLRGMLRAGASDAEIADRWRAAMWGKQAGHGIDAADFRRPVRSMGGIGG